MTAIQSPLWLRTFDRLLPVGTNFVLHGNTDDLWALPTDNHGTASDPADPDEPPTAPSMTLLSTLDAVWHTLSAAGYAFLLRWDPVTRRIGVVGDGEVSAATAMLGLEELPEEVSRTRLGELIRDFVERREHRGAFAIELASRMIADRGQLSSDEMQFFAACQLAAARSGPARASSVRPVALLNPIVWMTHRDTDLPAWFLSDTSGLRQLRLNPPDLEARLSLVRKLAPIAPGWASANEHQRETFITTLAEESDGFTAHDLLRISPLMADQRLGLDAVGDAVTVYRSGVLDNPWKRTVLRERLREGEQRIRSQVLGQHRAVAKVLDVLKRSATGLTAAHRMASSGPRGVLFFAGPTGVGKTELAKAMTKLIYGDEGAMIRFDMSEFASEHTEARLIGSPPGYIGHDAGGELTDAVRNRPFSLILLDEIDKADGRILDKFLQILDDGRLTDSHGRTVDFRDTVIVFTSNLGVSRKLSNGQRVELADPSKAPEVNEDIIRSEVKRHFNEELGRPELLNRIGDNIVAVDFIDRTVGRAILTRMIDQVVTTTATEQQVELDLEPVLEELEDVCLADLNFGGRGIGNALEGRLVNPLARALFDSDQRSRLTVTALHTDEDGVAQVVVA